MTQCPTVAKRLQLRHDTAANWIARNPVLLAGEIGIETDTNRMKLGKGLNNWNDLVYFPGDSTIGSVFDGGNPYSNYGAIPNLIDCGGVT